jgi:hypothetical protein
MLAISDSEILGRILELEGDRLSPEKARLVLSLNFSESDHARIEELGQKSNEGTLSAQEREEYAAYVRVGSILDILRAQARLVLTTLGKTV